MPGETETLTFDRVGEGTDSNNKKVFVTKEQNLFVVRDEKGERITHSDSFEGLVQAGFKVKPSAGKHLPGQQGSPAPETTKPPVDRAPAPALAKDKKKGKTTKKKK